MLRDVLPPNALPPPNRQDHPTISPWLDEQIWGHRIWEGQTPWLVFLEFLTVAEAFHRDGSLLEGDGAYPLNFKPYKRLYLRNILFNNEGLAQIARDNTDNASAWTEWLSWMADNARGVPTRDFSYLRRRFHSFHEFEALVAMLRSARVESETNRRWTSQFVFPFGPNALYEDLNLSTGGSPTREYINFGRTGELLYLMLCRSARACELRPPLQRLLGGENAWNRLLDRLQPGPDDDTSVRGRSYLPYRAHQCFDRLAEDWLQVLSLDLPGFDAFPHLVTLGSLHIMLYQLVVAAEWAGRRRPHVVCEVVAPRKTLVRELSSANYLENCALTGEAVQAYIARAERSEDWAQALTEHVPLPRCRQLLDAQFWWGMNAENCHTPERLLSELRVEAARRHRQHPANVQRNYGRETGLVSRRGTNRLRYAPNDSLLKTLVLANVTKRTELHAFLERLHSRYGLVFGEREAEFVLDRDDFDKKAFQANARRLEQRLGSLGMLRRLSDACAYVENPCARRTG